MNVTYPERSCILHSTRSVDIGWVNMRNYNFFVNGPKVAKFFVQRGRGCSQSPAFPIFDISISSGDIRD